MDDLKLSGADFQALYERLRGQAPWGAGDRLGALNYITPDRRLAAASEVRIGRSVTMASPMAGSAADNPEPGALHMKHLPAEPSAVAGLSFAADQLTTPRPPWSTASTSPSTFWRSTRWACTCSTTCSSTICSGPARRRAAGPSCARSRRSGCPGEPVPPGSPIAVL